MTQNKYIPFSSLVIHFEVIMGYFGYSFLFENRMLENTPTYFTCVNCHRASSPGRSEITKCTFLHLCPEGRRFIKTFPMKELLADVYIFAYVFLHLWASLVTHTVKNPPAMRETWVRSLGWDDPLEEGMATHSNILAWRIPMDRGARRAAVSGVARSRT